MNNTQQIADGNSSEFMGEMLISSIKSKVKGLSVGVRDQLIDSLASKFLSDGVEHADLENFKQILKAKVNEESKNVDDDHGEQVDSATQSLFNVASGYIKDASDCINDAAGNVSVIHEAEELMDSKTQAGNGVISRLAHSPDAKFGGKAVLTVALGGAALGTLLGYCFGTFKGVDTSEEDYIEC